MDNCIRCEGPSIFHICEDCQADLNIDITKTHNIDEIEFGEKLRDGFALIEANERPEDYNEIWG